MSGEDLVIEITPPRTSLFLTLKSTGERAAIVIPKSCTKGEFAEIQAIFGSLTLEDFMANRTPEEYANRVPTSSVPKTDSPPKEPNQ